MILKSRILHISYLGRCTFSTRPNPRRPPPLKSGKQPNRNVIFSSGKGMESEMLQKLHTSSKIVSGVFLPQFALNLTVGVPYLDYFHYSGVPALIACGLLTHPASVYLGSWTIKELSCDPSMKTVSMVTQAGNTYPDIPVTACRFNLAKNSLIIDNKQFRFHKTGVFVPKRLKLFEQRASTGRSPHPIDLSTLTIIQQMFNMQYWYIVAGTCVVLALTYLYSGYTDGLYVW